MQAYALKPGRIQMTIETCMKTDSYIAIVSLINIY